MSITPYPAKVFNPSNYIGQFSSEANALTYIRARYWTHDGTGPMGSGNPCEGTLFYDTTATALKIYIGGWITLQTGGPATSNESFMDFWSEPDELVSITTGGPPNPVALPNVVIPALTLGTSFTRVIIMMKYRKVRNTSASAQYLNAASCNLQVKESVAGSWTTGATIYQNAISVPGGPTDNPGDAIIGDDNVSAEVTQARVAAGKTFNIQFDDARTNTGAAIELHDVQTGIRIFYK